MSVEKTLHVQVIYIQGHFFHGVAGEEEQWPRGEQGGKIGILLSVSVQNSMLFGQKHNFPQNNPSIEIHQDVS